MKGKFITVEGGEGAGKSTCLATILSVLEDHAIPHVTTREPGSTPAGERIRSILLDAELDDLCPEAELLLMYAARAELLAETIRPALAAGQWVVSDRFSDASYAYQGGGRGLPRERLDRLEEWIVGDCRPHLTILLDVDPEAGLARAVHAREADRFEREAALFYTRVREAYLRIAAAEPERIKVVDAGQSLETVRRAVHREVSDFVGARVA
ncbi:MAG: dTMP kinase [Xanthomonadales bacterium]|nr:dTMP kinase [Xanthomonadales bacterium]